MAGFTKGPWQVRRAKLADNTGGYDWAVSVDSKVIAEVFEHVDYADDGDGFEKFPAEANARAIAEVPAMAELLDDLIESHGLRPGHVGYISKSSLLRRARAILNRIEGEA